MRKCFAGGFVVFVLQVWFFVARGTCGEPPTAPISPPAGFRDKLTAAELLSGLAPELLHNAYYMPIGEPLASVHAFSGTIQFPETEMRTLHPDRDWNGSGHRWFPAFSLPFISDGKFLIPMKRGIIYSGNRLRSYWNIIVDPGRVWREPDDNGYSRASFPFVLTDNFVGQARNGLATFVFNSKRISNVAVQITQETAPVSDYVIADFAGMIPAQYKPAAFPDRDQQILEFKRELAARPVVRPWTELPNHAFTQEYFRGGLPANSTSAAALLIDGQLYIQPMETRTGAYPYPREMRHGVYSVTKSLCMGLAMFYAAQKYGGDLFEERIAAYVPALSAHPGWKDVTFEDAFGMATGTQGGDSGDDILPFIAARSAEAKLAVVHELPDAPPLPGQVFNYASTNTFVLSCALDRFVRAKEGPDADLWGMVKRDVLKPMGIPHLPVARTVEDGSMLGVPVMGWGTYPTVCEAAMIGRLLHDEGVFKGVQLLNKNRVREALYRTSRSGLDAGRWYNYQAYYLHSMWGFAIQLPSGLIHAPSMCGRGGNFVIVMPSGIVAIRFSDEDYYDVTPMVAVAELYASRSRQYAVGPGQREGGRCEAPMRDENRPQLVGNSPHDVYIHHRR